MMRRAPVWEEDTELAAEAKGLKAEARKPNGHDRGAGSGRRIELVRFDDMQPQLSEPDLVQGLLGSAQLGTILGAPGTGKTFLALDIALHVAAGLPWFGRRVKQGTVVYVAAEAGKKIYNRVHAWWLRHRPANKAPTFKPGSMAEKIRHHVMRERGDATPRMEAGQKMPFYCVPNQIDLCTTDQDLDALIEAIRDACGDEPPVLLVIDTVSRVMAGGNENSPEDMGALIASADQLRDEFDATVCLVHHLGKDASRGARGHSSLKGAVDTEIEVTRDDEAKLSMARVAKQRDGEIGERVHFALEVTTIGENEETGEPVTSCVVIAPDAERVAQCFRQVQAEQGRADSAQRAGLADRGRRRGAAGLGELPGPEMDPRGAMAEELLPRPHIQGTGARQTRCLPASQGGAVGRGNDRRRGRLRLAMLGRQKAAESGNLCRGMLRKKAAAVPIGTAASSATVCRREMGSSQTGSRC